MTVTDPTLDALHRALDDRPRDQGLRLVLADRYDELGDADTAECLRWCAAKGREPFAVSDPKWSWATWTADHIHDRSEVPGCLAAMIRGKTDPVFSNQGVLVGSRNRRSAEAKLAAAWRRLPPGGRAECWAWEPPKKALAAR